MVKVILILSLAAWALVRNPIVDTDKSVNTASIKTIIADLIDSSMTDEEKIDALFRFHRRTMYHFPTDPWSSEIPGSQDPVDLYGVYGCSFCGQQALALRGLVAALYGDSNTAYPAGYGLLADTTKPGGHVSFMFRFNGADAWRWVDPTIGAYARNRTDGAIASIIEIMADTTLLTRAIQEGRASMPYFPCTAGEHPRPDSLPPAYSYHDFDFNFVVSFFNSITGGLGKSGPLRKVQLINMTRTLKQGESYKWLWDFLEGDYFLKHKTPGDSSTGAAGRAWPWSLPRHICGWKDSLDTRNWPYFKPYRKIVRGDTCYRYYANGIQAYAPDWETAEPKDDIFIRKNASFYAEDGHKPCVRPGVRDSISEIWYKFSLPYPVLSVAISCNYVKRSSADSLSLYVGRIKGEFMDAIFRVKSFDVDTAGRFDTTLRDMVDPWLIGKIYNGYVLKFVMKGPASATDVGINSLKVQSIFQHNMFARPQLEPGANQVTVSVDSGDLSREYLKAAFAWIDGGDTVSDERRITASGQPYAINVQQSEMPRMVSMALGNTKNSLIGTEKRPEGRLEDACAILAYPNPFNPAIRIFLPGMKGNGLLRIYNVKGEKVKQIPVADYGSRNNLVWDASGVPSGVYLLQVVSGERLYSRKVILQR